MWYRARHPRTEQRRERHAHTACERRQIGVEGCLSVGIDPPPFFSPNWSALDSQMDALKFPIDRYSHSLSDAPRAKNTCIRGTQKA
jgi:hypothetical protein